MDDDDSEGGDDEEGVEPQSDISWVNQVETAPHPSISPPTPLSLPLPHCLWTVARLLPYPFDHHSLPFKTIPCPLRRWITFF